MNANLNTGYRLEYSRYRHYFHQIWDISQKPQMKVSLALLLTIFTVIIFAVFAIRPTLSTVAELINKIEEQEVILSKLKQKASFLSTAQQQYISASSQIFLLYQAVPEDYQLQSLIKLIEATAAYHNVSLEGVTYGNISYEVNTAPKTGQPKQLTVTLKSIDDYDKVNAFITDLSNLQRTLLLQNLKLQTPNKRKQVANNPEIEFSISSDAIYLPRNQAILGEIEL